MFAPFAVKADVTTLILTSTNTPYNLLDHAIITHDPESRLNTQDIIKNHGSTTSNQEGFHPKTSWVSAQLQNNTENSDWVIDFGTLGDGRSGLIKNLYIYNSANREVLFNSSHGNQHELIHNNKINFTFKPNEMTSLVFYIEAEHYLKNINLPFQIQAATHALENPRTEWFMFNHIGALIILKLSIILFGLLLSRSLGFIPVLIYYSIYLLWWYYMDLPPYSDVAGQTVFTSAMPFISGILIGLTCILTIPGRYSHHALRLTLFTFIFFSTLSMIGLSTFLGPLARDITPYVAFVFNISLYAVSCLFLLKHQTAFLKPASKNLAVWIGLIALSQIIMMGVHHGLIPSTPYTVHADYILMWPQLICVFIAVIASIKSDHLRSINRVLRQAKKSQEVLKAQKSKENSDHSRLLRVIEREREIMEELRGRESERAEEMRNAKNQADEANQAKSAFLAVVSHEIRTPMTGVMGMIKLLESTALSSEQKDYVETIRDSGEAMVSLLNDILDFSKIEGGGMDIETIDFDLKKLAGSVITLMKGHADQKNIQLILEYDSQLENQFLGDPTRLRQILLNLIGNALKFTDKGHVKLIIKKDDNQKTYFAVEDTGIGISEEAQKDLFQPFSQADSTISRKYGGTGLGLTICKKLIEAMNGKIQINSRESIGTTFFFSLPIQTAKAKDQNEKTGTPVEIQSKNLNIIVVDDNDVNLKVMKGFLKQFHHNVTTFASAKDAIEAIKFKQPDFVFMDIEMPDMNGHEAIKIIRDSVSKNLPVVAMTGNVSDDDIQNYSDEGFTSHLAKPIDQDALVNILNGGDTIASQSSDTITEESPKDISFVEKDHKKTKASKDATTLDEAMIQGLKDGLGAQQTQSLLVDLFTKTDEILQQIKDAITQSQLEDIKDRAHELKGMAGNFGLKAVSVKAGEIEKLAQEEALQASDFDSHEKDLSTLVERSKIAIENFLEN